MALIDGAQAPRGVGAIGEADAPQPAAGLDVELGGRLEHLEQQRERYRVRVLAVVAHYDVHGEVGPHVRRLLDELTACGDVVFVTTSHLDEPSADYVRERAELIQRPNYGYDFFSWKIGLDARRERGQYDYVLITNDSYVGPLRPLPQIFEDMAAVPADFWGFTRSERVAPHVQSFFVAFRPWVVASRAFIRFWDRMEPLSDRKQVIKRYEVGLSTALLEVGFRSAAVFNETDDDRRLARRRNLWWGYRRSMKRPKGERTLALRTLPFEPWNPAAALADAALDAGRLPYVKLDTLRYDPYELDSDALLVACESVYPEHFEGVREYLRARESQYKPRPGESAGPTRPPLGVRQLLGYGVLAR